MDVNNLIDISGVLSGSKRKLHQTANGHFKRYLEECGHPFQGVSDMSGDILNAEFIGKFSDFIHKRCPRINNVVVQRGCRRKVLKYKYIVIHN